MKTEVKIEKCLDKSFFLCNNVAVFEPNVLKLLVMDLGRSACADSGPDWKRFGLPCLRRRRNSVLVMVKHLLTK